MKFTLGSISNSSRVLDTDTQNFLTVTGIRDKTIVLALNKIVVDAKAHGWWTLSSGIWPFVGGTNHTCKFNLKNPLDTDAAFRLTFIGGVSFASTGVTWNNTNSYANTHLTPSGALTQNSASLGIYCRTSTPPAAFGGSAIGGNNSTTTYFEMGWDSGGTPTRAFYGLNSIADNGIANQARQGFTLITRTDSNNIFVYFNGSQVANTAEASATPSTASVYLGAYHETPSDLTDGFDIGEYAFAIIGSAITPTIQANMYTDIQAFQTALGRNV